MLRTIGTPARARVLVEIGGKFHNMWPGHSIVAPFSSFTVVRRNYATTRDVRSTVPTDAFFGELAFVVSKKAEFLINEPNFVDAPPWFRSIDVLGRAGRNSTVLGPGQEGLLSPVWAGPYSTASGAAGAIACGGARRIRIWYARTNLPNSDVPATIVAGDVIGTTLYAYLLTQVGEDMLEMDVPGVADASASSGIPNVTWAVGDEARVMDIELSGAPDMYNIKFTVSGGHDVYVLIQGVP